MDSFITQLKAQGPSRTCNESEEEEEAWYAEPLEEVKRSKGARKVRFLRIEPCARSSEGGGDPRWLRGGVALASFRGRETGVENLRPDFGVGFWGWGLGVVWTRSREGRGLKTPPSTTRSRKATCKAVWGLGFAWTRSREGRGPHETSSSSVGERSENCVNAT